MGTDDELVSGQVMPAPSGARSFFSQLKPVWVVDDDRSIRWVFEKALTREGIPFKTFGLAQDAMEALAISPPQVLVSDIRMPGASGLELLQMVRERYPTLPVIIMTAYSDLESAVAAFQGGAFEYLPKPFDVDQAVDLIRRALDESLRGVEAEQVEPQSPEILGQAFAVALKLLLRRRQVLSVGSPAFPGFVLCQQ